MDSARAKDDNKITITRPTRNQVKIEQIRSFHAWNDKMNEENESSCINGSHIQQTDQEVKSNMDTNDTWFSLAHAA